MSAWPRPRRPHVLREPDYYLARCTGSKWERKEAADFKDMGMRSDREIVALGLETIEAPRELLALVRSGMDVSQGKVYFRIVAALKNYEEV